jgi:hypothetical protein
VGGAMQEVSPMEDTKSYLLAELAVLPGFLEEVKAIFKEALIPTLQEPGCEALSIDRPPATTSYVQKLAS